MAATLGMVDENLIATRRPERFEDKVSSGQTWTDQWGRQWAGTIDKKTLHPVGGLSPKGWRAPDAKLVPPSKYWAFPKGQIGRVVILVDEWITDESASWDAWKGEMTAHAQKQFAQMAAEAMEKEHPVLMSLVGPSPMHLDFLRAMKAGNSWVLGKDDPRTGHPYPATYKPEWARTVWSTLRRFETFDGSQADLSVDVARFADEGVDGFDPTPIDPELARFQDIEEAADPDAAPSFAPLPRRSHHKRKEE